MHKRTRLPADTRGPARCYISPITPPAAAHRPFKIAVPDATSADIRARVMGFHWHEMPDDRGWDYGANLDFMQALCAHWVDGFDWRRRAGGFTSIF